MQLKDIKSVEELKKYFSCSTKMVDHLTSLLSFREFKKAYNVLNTFKKRGYSMDAIFPLLLILLFLKHASIHALFKSRSKDLSCAGKDAYYCFKNLEIIPLRRLLLNFVRRFISIVEKRGVE